MAATLPERRPPLGVSVNLSRRQLQHADFVDDVRARAARRPARPAIAHARDHRDACSMRGHARRRSSALRALKALGVRLAVDDFGTGYSSLRYLRQLPLDMLKMPKPFVDDVAGDGRGSRRSPSDHRARRDSLELEVVAEGIETADQLASCDALGCELGQGFLFARPSEAADIEALVDGRVVPLGAAALRGAA